MKLFDAFCTHKREENEQLITSVIVKSDVLIHVEMKMKLFLFSAVDHSCSSFNFNKLDLIENTGDFFKRNFVFYFLLPCSKDVYLFCVLDICFVKVIFLSIFNETLGSKRDGISMERRIHKRELWLSKTLNFILQS